MNALDPGNYSKVTNSVAIAVGASDLKKVVCQKKSP